MRGDGTTPTNNTGGTTQKNVPAPNAASKAGPTTRPSQSGGTGDGGASSSTSSTSGVTSNVAITPEVTVQVGGGYYLGFQPITNTSWSSSTTNQVSCTGGNSDRAGGDLSVTSSTTSTSQVNLGCSVSASYTWENAQADMDYEIRAQADIIKGNPGVSLEFRINL